MSRGDVTLFVLVAILVGVLHRSALSTPWAEDRLLGGDPPWLQLASPFWHSVVGESSSLANQLIRLADPLTSASTAGDTRGVAATLTSLAIAGLLTIMARAAVPAVLAALLGLTAAGPVLPVAATASVAHALQMLAAVALLLAWCSARVVGTTRYLTLAALTIAGALNHPAFVAFAAGIWLAELFYATPRTRPRVVAAAAASQAAALAASALLLQADMAPPPAIQVARPDTFALGVAIVTGQFAADLQPQQQGGLLQALSGCVPWPFVLCVPLAALGILRTGTQRIALACALALTVVLLFSAGTWVPDLVIAGASARVALVVLIGLGVSALWNEPLGWGRVLAFGATAFIGITPLLRAERDGAVRTSAEMQAFVESAREHLQHALWSADRLPTARALLTRHDPALRDARVSSGVDAVRHIPEDRLLVSFVGMDGPRARGDFWFVPYELPHPTADSFVASQTATRWLAVAVRGPATAGFCRALLNRLHVTDLGSDERVSVLARLGDHEATAIAHGRLERRYGDEIVPHGDRVPAHFVIDTDPAVRTTVNGESSPQVRVGMIVTVFDAWHIESRSWKIDNCVVATLPSITDRRLGVAYALPIYGAPQLPRIPVVTRTRVDIPLDDAGNAWFGAGWHATEGPGGESIRWTSSQDAHVHVLLSHRQPLRVRLSAHLAERHPGSNALSLLWNGTLVASSSAVPADEQEWTVPATLVRRGLNTLTLHVRELVTPASFGNSTDTRLVGAAVRKLSLEPIQGATAASSSTVGR